MEGSAQMKYDLARVKLEKRRIDAEERELDLIQRLAAAGQRKKRPEPAFVDLSEDLDKADVKEEKEEDNGQSTVQDTIVPPLSADNAAAQASMSVMEKKAGHKIPVLKAEKEISLPTFPAGAENGTTLDWIEPEATDDSDFELGSQASATVQEDSNGEDDTIPKLNVNLRSQHPELIDIQPGGTGTTGNAPSDNPPQGKDKSVAARQSKKPRMAKGVAVRKSKKGRKAHGQKRKDGSTAAPLGRRRELAGYYRDLLARHLDSLYADGHEGNLATEILVAGTVQCDPYRANRQILRIMATKPKPAIFEETMEQFASNWWVWWRACQALPRLDEQKAMIKRVVGQIIDGTIDYKEFDKKHA